MATPKTGEPTHTDEDGKERPGAADLLGVVNPTTVKNAEGAWADNNADLKVRNRKSAQFPNVKDPHSPLSLLINEAIGLFGNMSTDTIPGSILMTLLRRANSIVEDVRIHPYTTLPDLDYYISFDDVRPIPDEIMIAGLLYHYSFWMKSDFVKNHYIQYQKTLGQILYQRKFGSGKIQMNTIDKEEAPS